MTDLPEFNPADYSQSEVIQHQPPTNDRSLARRIALQILYEVDSAHHEVIGVLMIHLEAREISSKTARYTRWLVLGVVNHQATLDETIHRYAPEWPIEQMAIIDRNILRIAAYEFAVATRIPVGVAIDEAVQLAKVFGADSSPAFVNGVLGALAEDKAMLEQLRISETEDPEGEE